MKVRKAGAWILMVALMASMLGGCSGGGNSSSASSSASTAQAEATADASASTEASEEAKPAEEASTAEAASTAEEASDTVADGEAHPGRLVAFTEGPDGSAEVTGTWLELNDDDTGTLCLDGMEYAITYTTEEIDESVDNGLTDGGIVYLIEVEDGSKLQGFFLGLGMFTGIAVDEFMPANEIIRYDGGEEEDSYMMVEEGSEFWNMMMGQ